MVRLARNNGLYKAVDKLWKLGVNVAVSCAQPRRPHCQKKAIKKAAQQSGFFKGEKSLRCFAVHGHGDVHQHVSVQSHADCVVARGFQRADWHADL